MAVLLISVGSNIERDLHTRAARTALEQVFSQVTVSRVFESESVGFKGSPFYNWVARARTDKTIADVCRTLKEIERENGRKHTDKKFSPRTLDLDLLTYDQQVTNEPVILPREEILYNAFVLQPLAELVPEERHPVVDRSYKALWQAFDKSSQKLYPIEFTWSE